MFCTVTRERCGAAQDAPFRSHCDPQERDPSGSGRCPAAPTARGRFPARHAIGKIARGLLNGESRASEAATATAASAVEAESTKGQWARSYIVHSSKGAPDRRITWMAGGHSVSSFGCRATVNPSIFPAPRGTRSGQLLGRHTAMHSGVVLGSASIRAWPKATQDHQSSRVRRNFRSLFPEPTEPCRPPPL